MPIGCRSRQRCCQRCPCPPPPCPPPRPPPGSPPVGWVGMVAGGFCAVPLVDVERFFCPAGGEVDPFGGIADDAPAVGWVSPDGGTAVFCAGISHRETGGWVSPPCPDCEVASCGEPPWKAAASARPPSMVLSVMPET